MRTIKLKIEYDGSDFVGWQRQPNGLSVQEVLEGALAQLLGSEVSLTSSGRTDAGVHALGMVAHFHTDRDLPLKAFRDGVNSFLPATVAVQQAEEAAEHFHARFDARGKWYRYSIFQAAVRSPLLADRAWWLRSPLDIAAMEQAAAAFVGRHDFAVFRTSGCAAKTTIREIFSVELQSQDRLLVVDVRGSGFLRNMVRMMVGTLVEIGQGKRPVEAIGELLNCKDGCGPAHTAPAQGLCLMEVWY